jgi:hypothetical protein
MADSKKALMIARTEEYLNLHRQDSERYPANIAAVAKFIPVARRLFYKTDPEIEALIAKIEAANRSRPPAALPAATLTSEDAGLRNLGDDDLAEEVARTVRRATWAMQRWLGIAKRAPDISEAAMVAAYLDEALRQSRKAHVDLVALVQEVQERDAGTSRIPEPASDQLKESDLFGDV